MCLYESDHFERDLQRDRYQIVVQNYKGEQGKEKIGRSLRLELRQIPVARICGHPPGRKTGRDKTDYNQNAK